MISKNYNNLERDLVYFVAMIVAIMGRPDIYNNSIYISQKAKCITRIHQLNDQQNKYVLIIAWLSCILDADIEDKYKIGQQLRLFLNIHETDNTVTEYIIRCITAITYIASNNIKPIENYNDSLPAEWIPICDIVKLAILESRP